MTRVLETGDVAELLEMIAATRWRDGDEDGFTRAWRGAVTLRWVERRNEMDGLWRRGNSYAYHRWGYGE